jgi:hypothetical protein
MTVPENFMTYRGPVDRLRYRVQARNAGLRSRTGFSMRVVISKMKTRHPFHLDLSSPPLDQPRFVPFQHSQRAADTIEIP